MQLKRSHRTGTDWGICIRNQCDSPFVVSMIIYLYMRQKTRYMCYIVDVQRLNPLQMTLQPRYRGVTLIDKGDVRTRPLKCSRIQSSHLQIRESAGGKGASSSAVPLTARLEESESCPPDTLHSRLACHPKSSNRFLWDRR